MNRASIVYVGMLLVLVCGLWAVLAMGAHLTAPEDLAGKWQLQSNVRGIPDDTLNIEQSGRFFQVAFGNGPLIDLKMADDTEPLRLVNGDMKLIIAGPPGSDDKTIESNKGRWTAHRISRTFPPDGPVVHAAPTTAPVAPGSRATLKESH